MGRAEPNQLNRADSKAPHTMTTTDQQMIMTTKQPPARQVSQREVVFHYLALAALMVVTRGILFGNYLGEADAARYVFGLRFWLESGPTGPAIINRELSPGYYWFDSVLVRAFHVPYNRFPLLLNTLSVLAGIAAALVLYRLAGIFISRRAALASTIVLAISPAFWWASVEPHPQMVALCFTLLSMLLFVEGWRSESPRAVPLVLSAICLALVLVTKSDFFLLVCTYPVLRIFLELRDKGRASWNFCLRAAMYSGAVVLGGYFLGAAIKLMLLRGASAAPSALGHVLYYLQIPRGIRLVLQTVPAVFAPGVITFLLAGVCAIVFFLNKRNPRWRWLLLIASWSVPGYVFWLLIFGNNVRHLIALPIPILWLTYSWLEEKGIVALLGALALPLVAVLVIPAHSNPTTFPSPNVPGSWAQHQSLQSGLRSIADHMFAQGAQPSCYLGAATQDYIIQRLLVDADRSHYRVAVLPGPGFRANLYSPDGAFVHQVYVIGPVRDASALDLSECSTVDSVEYTGRLRTHRYFGNEWIGGIPWLPGGVGQTTAVSRNLTQTKRNTPK
jgi:hypothetical protein